MNELIRKTENTDSDIKDDARVMKRAKGKCLCMRERLSSFVTTARR